MSIAKRGTTLNDVVAANIRSLREERHWSRKNLAELMSARSPKDVSKWRVLDLEGGRSPTTPPRPATWPELALLMTIFGVQIYELVLPADEDTRVVPPFIDGRFADVGIGIGMMTRRTMAEGMFGFPIEWIDRRENTFDHIFNDPERIKELEEFARQRTEAIERLAEALEGAGPEAFHESVDRLYTELRKEERKDE